MPKPTPRHRRPRGFSLLELGVAMAITGVLGSMGYTALSNLRGRASSRNGLQMLVLSLQKARSEAFGRGLPVVFTLGPVSASDPTLRARTFVDVGANYVPGVADTNDLPLDSVELPAGVTYVPTGTPGLNKPLPPPFSGLPASAPCSFCTSGTPPTAYAMFQTDGSVRLGSPLVENPLGGTFTLVSGSDVATVAIVGTVGLVQRFDLKDRR